MRLLVKLAIMGVCLGTSINAEWDPNSLYQVETNSALKLLCKPDYSHLKAKIRQVLTNSWCSSEKIELLMDLTLLTRPAVCVEIGACTGASSLPVAAILKYLNHGCIYTIDAWSNEVAIRNLNRNDPNRAWWQSVDMDNVYRSFEHLMNHFSVMDYCIPICKSSGQAVYDIPGEIDFLHLDGDYSEKGALEDVELYLPKVKVGGYILLSNLNMRVENKQTKVQSFCTLFNSCEIVTFIENSNAVLFRRR